MFGVGRVFTDYGGGGGSYVGGVCRTVKRWWTGSDWSDDPVYTGPFQTREEAEDFIAKQPKHRYVHLYAYEGDDAFGENPPPRCRYCRTGEGHCCECV